jgi:uncharacterized protein YacL
MKTPRFIHSLSRFFFQPVLIARILFILLTTWSGMMLGRESKLIEIFGGEFHERFIYSLLAFSAALIITIFEHATDAVSSHKLLMAVFGCMFGLVFSNLVYTTIPSSLTQAENVRIVCNLFFGYFGMILAIKHAERFHLSRLKFFLSPAHERPKVLDSSVIIDGRIIELITLQVISGPVTIPDFVLNEIQGIADSQDNSRKSRGRRGLEILEDLRANCPSLEILDKNYPDIREVDHKLVRLCREMDADLITNDYNLQKIAHVHQITVININEIANSLKPAVYIGEMFNIHVVRDGKEAGQGVGYLEDGTMVVIDDASSYMNQEISVVVSSILQTPSGRLVFAKPQGVEDKNPQASITY